MGTLPVHNRSNNENMEEILKIIQKETEMFEKPTDKDERKGFMTLNVEKSLDPLPEQEDDSKDPHDHIAEAQAEIEKTDQLL